MGVTKTVCRCRPPYTTCKGGITQDGTDCFDHDHWLEVRTNLGHYLAEDICVPGAKTTERVPSDFFNALSAYLASLDRARNSQIDGVEQASKIMTDVHASSTKILQIGLQLATERSIDHERLVATALPDINESDRCMSMARVLTVAARRAMHELVESIEQASEFYIYHHHAVLLDISLEMARLLNEALNSRSEQFLDSDHPHAIAIREYEQQWPEAAE